MTWACMAANGPGSTVFTDDVTVDRSSRMNFEVYMALLSDQIQPNAIKLVGICFPVKMDGYCSKSLVKNLREGNQHLVMTIGSRFHAFIRCKGFSSIKNIS